MEIDFLGLHSKISDFDFVERKNLEFVGSESEEDDISLSLCTSSQLGRNGAEFSDFRQKNSLKFPSKKMVSASSSCSVDTSNSREREQSCLSLVGKPILHPSSFICNHTHKLPALRNMFDLPDQPASVNLFFQADHKMYMASSASSEDTQNSPRGYVPTVAMARRATLARFLEKRSHRLTKPRKSNLMGRTVRVSEDCHMNITQCNNKNHNNIRW